MAWLWTVLNLMACGVIWFVAMYFYLRHGRPRCVRHHASQIALVFVAVGAMAIAISELRGHPAHWWEILFRTGVALHMAHWLWRWRLQRGRVA